jgi:hypothetical protein
MNVYLKMYIIEHFYALREIKYHGGLSDPGEER